MRLHQTTRHPRGAGRTTGALLASLATIAAALTVSPQAGALQSATTALAKAPAKKPTCTQLPATDGDEPRCNPFLADSPWPGAQRNSYAQGSSPLAGPIGPAERIGISHIGVTGGPVFITYSSEYADGGRAIWASTVGVTGEVLKIDADTHQLIDKYVPGLEGGDAFVEPTVSGAYNLLDADDRFIVGTGDSIQVFGDAQPGERMSAIERLHVLELPEQALCGDDDALVGITMTYDGRVVFATRNGIVGTVPRTPRAMTAERLRIRSINGRDCDSLPAESREEVSNSIAADEDGGIYVVTSGALYRLEETRRGLRQVWRSAYGGAGESGAGRIGSGSGSTPSLMGTDPRDDRFVVITDGQEQVHLDLMWRDKIPRGWEPVRPGASRRIACEVPITYGKEPGAPSANEQSVLVRGNSAVVVNNLQGLNDVLSALPPVTQTLTQLLSGLPGNAPSGVERVDWDPRTRTCEVVWQNPDVSIPNGIPTMSVATDMFYGIGARNGMWTLEGLDFDTGEVRLTVPTSPLPTSNSFYAATTIGPDGSIVTGTFGGMMRFRQCTADEVCERLDPLEAAVGQPPLDPEGLVNYLTGLPNP